MKLLLFSSGAFTIALLIHFGWWRIRLPLYHTSALLGNFGLVYVACILSSYVLSVSGYAPSSAIEWGHFTLFYLPLSLSYVSFYSLIEHDSPSFLIVRAIAKPGRAGCSINEIQGLFQEDIIESRLKAAVANGLVQAVGDHWMLTSKGRLVGSISKLVTQIYGIRDGG